MCQTCRFLPKTNRFVWSVSTRFGFELLNFVLFNSLIPVSFHRKKDIRITIVAWLAETHKKRTVTGVTPELSITSCPNLRFARYGFVKTAMSHVSLSDLGSNQINGPRVTWFLFCGHLLINSIGLLAVQKKLLLVMRALGELNPADVNLLLLQSRLLYSMNTDIQ